MRLVDADELDTKLFNDGFFGGLAACIGNTPRKRKFTIGEFRGMLKKAPTIDAVPVVRCWECENHTHDEVFGTRVCKISRQYVKERDFCSYGERRDEEI